MTVEHEEVLLGHLAASGWFMQQGEVALTTGLTFCLNKDVNAAAAFVGLACRAAEAPPDHCEPIEWQAEWIDDEGQRPDVIGWSDSGSGRVPVVVVEAKVSASFGDSQISHYLTDQHRRLLQGGAPTGVLVALVPDDRVAIASREIERDLARLGDLGAGPPWVFTGRSSVHITVLSWGEALSAMETANGPAVADIRQLAGAARALRLPDIRAFDVNDLAGDWRDRLDDLHVLIDRVTKQVSAELRARGLDAPPLPWQPKPSDGLEGGFRYIGEPDQPNLAVGVAAPDVTVGDASGREVESPLWIRWHRATTDAHEVEQRLQSRGLACAVDSSGLVWMPLELEPDVGLADRQIAHLVQQTVEAFLASRRPGNV